MTFLLLALALALLLAGAVVFTNAVEWAGLRLGLGAGAIIFLLDALVLGLAGSDLVRILAAVGFVVAYVLYVWRTVKHGGEAGERPDRLYFDPARRDAPLSWTSVAVRR